MGRALGMTAVGLLAFGASLGPPSPARADRIRLRGGGEIAGLVVPDAARPEKVLVQTATAAKPIVFAKDQVVSVIDAPGPLDDYLAARGKIEPTAQAQYDFGLWCEESKLPGPAQIHYQKAIEIDPRFGPAHKKLGHVLLGSRWLTYDEQRQAQGLVKFKGKWISQVEKAKLDAQAALSAEQASWASRLKLLRRRLYDEDSNVRQQAEAQISAIREPAAVPGLIRAFSGDDDAVRIRLAQLLAAIPGPEATGGLIMLIVNEADADVRLPMLDELNRRHDPDTTRRLIAVLREKNPEVVGRAAWALASTKTTSAVPRLVDALIQSEKRTVLIPVSSPSGGGISGSFGFSQNLSGGPQYPVNSAPGFSTIASQPVLTGVAVGPGVAAYGASSVPYGTGLNPTPNLGSDPYRTLPSKITVYYQNLEVLKALVGLTGVNHGFDQVAWRRWMGTSFRAEAAPARRAPEP